MFERMGKRRLVVLGLEICIFTLGTLITIAFLLHDESVLKTEPAPFTMPTGSVVLVHNGECPWGQLQKVVGSTVGVDRHRECISQSFLSHLSIRVVHYIEGTFSKLYVVLTVLGTIAGSLAVIPMVVSRFSKRGAGE